MILQGSHSTDPHLLLLTPDLESAAKWKVELCPRRERFVIATYQPVLDCVPTSSFDLALVDVTSTTQTPIALNVCRQLRKQSQNPILLLTPEQDESQIIGAFKIGVDDCICKPIGTDLLLAKIKAWRRFTRYDPPCPPLRYHTSFDFLLQS